MTTRLARPALTRWALGILGVLCALLALTFAVPSPAGVLLSWQTCQPVDTAHPFLDAERKARVIVLWTVAPAEGLPEGARVIGAGCDLDIAKGNDDCYAAPEIPGVGLVDAWDFSGLGCPGGGRLAVTYAPSRTGCTPPPSRSATSQGLHVERLSFTSILYGCHFDYGHLRIDTVMPAWTPVTDSTYALWEIEFDLSGACSQSGGGAGCCDDAGPTELAARGVVELADGTEIEFFDAGNTIEYTPAAVTPALATSWGRIKAQYR